MDLPEYDLGKAYTAQDPHAGGGCSITFGSNLRAGGVVLGACVALGGGTEHEGDGTPHLHLQKFKDGKFTFVQWAQCQAKADMDVKPEEDWHD
eukprot:473576-Karenia_brevis.AAC.1